MGESSGLGCIIRKRSVSRHGILLRAALGNSPYQSLIGMEYPFADRHEGNVESLVVDVPN